MWIMSVFCDYFYLLMAGVGFELASVSGSALQYNTVFPAVGDDTPGQSGGWGQGTTGLLHSYLTAGPVEWEVWFTWSECTRTCGRGTQIRVKMCENITSGSCDERLYHPDVSHVLGYSLSFQDCNVQTCPIHGYWASWGEWSECSSQCGGGTRQKDRACLGPWDGGIPCEGAKKKYETCNVESCAEPPSTVSVGAGNFLKVTLTKADKRRSATSVGVITWSIVLSVMVITLLLDLSTFRRQWSFFCGRSPGQSKKKRKKTKKKRRQRRVSIPLASGNLTGTELDSPEEIVPWLTREEFQITDQGEDDPTDVMKSTQEEAEDICLPVPLLSVPVDSTRAQSATSFSPDTDRLMNYLNISRQNTDFSLEIQNASRAESFVLDNSSRPSSAKFFARQPERLPGPEEVVEAGGGGGKSLLDLPLSRLCTSPEGTIVPGRLSRPSTPEMQSRTTLGRWASKPIRRDNDSDGHPQTPDGAMKHSANPNMSSRSLSASPQTGRNAWSANSRCLSDFT